MGERNLGQCDLDSRRLWRALIAVCLLSGAAIGLSLLMWGCTAGVKASGGSSTVEHQESKPKTETVEIEVFGREPTADELYILHGLGKGARR